MIEKVNPMHPDKVADRIAGALVDLAYTKQENPKIAVEVLIGHGNCYIIAETSVHISKKAVKDIVERISGVHDFKLDYVEVPQDAHLAKNQSKEIRCGDNGIFSGTPTNKEEKILSETVKNLYCAWPSDGKFIYDRKGKTFIACQSNAKSSLVKKAIKNLVKGVDKIEVNPLGEWTGGTMVDSGATNRKLGSDMGRAVTGGGLHGKDLSKADVSVNIVCYMLAQSKRKKVTAFCAIGDKEVFFKIGRKKCYIPYSEVVRVAKKYIEKAGGFENFASWGLV